MLFPWVIPKVKKQAKLEQHLVYFKGVWNHGRYPVLRHYQQRLNSPFRTSAHIQKGPRGLTPPPPRCPQRIPGGSQGCRCAEQQGHLLIRHSLLLSHTHGLTQVDGQDVFALRGKECRRRCYFKRRFPQMKKANMQFLPLSIKTNDASSVGSRESSLFN